MITPLNNKHRLDPVSELLKLKHEWFLKYVHMKNSCVCYKVNLIEKLTEHDDEVVSCPKHFVDMAEHLESDPDPYFTDTSNWYYAGNLFEFNRDELTFSPDVAASFDCGEGNNIYESICSSQDIIALRTKRKVFVLKIVTSNDQIKIEQLKVAESETPFTSISFDEYHKNILYVTDINNDLKIVNIDRLTARTIKMKNKINSLVNNWSSVIGSERPYFTHVAGNSITLYDKRTNEVIHTWDNLSKVTDDATCNRITAAKYSPGSPYMYFGTNHHLFLMDLRYQMNTELKLVQRWTHGMQCYPTYISICNFEFNKELVCLSSQWCEDMCIVPNYIQSLKDSGFTGVTLPYRPPSILQTMNEARNQALCLDVYNSLENRLVTALSGILLVEQGEKYIILSQNALGDISSHMLYPEHMEMFIEDDSVQALHDWSQDNVTEKEDFEVSFVRDISKVWKKLKKVPDGAINEQFTKETTFSEQEIHDMFQNGELDEGLLDVWVDEDNTNVEDLSLGLSLNITQE
ncbi:hypothetical protein MSG28_012473 [Choristoneura fumiferana]|nr:hypothetical protein MSG28_012473 [Choristoneura fumiferana]